MNLSAVQSAIAASSAASTASPEAIAAARSAGQQFESFFIGQVMESMYAGVEADPTFGGGPGENAFRSMLLDEYGKAAAQHGGFGIAEAVTSEILRLQEAK